MLHIVGLPPSGDEAARSRSLDISAPAVSFPAWRDAAAIAFSYVLSAAGVPVPPVLKWLL
jgi:hypothetical protein